MSQDPGPRRPVVGVDLGGTWIRAGLAGDHGQLLRRIKVPTQSRGGPGAIQAQITELVRELIAGDGRAPEEVLLVVGVPGPMNPASGVVEGAPNLPGWDRVPLRDRLESELGCRCLIEHDVDLAAVAEHRRGVGRGTQDFIYVTVSTGIGAGLILDGRLHRGSGTGTGEFGHIVVLPDGPRCGCGNRGCLEAVASGSAIAREAGRASAEEVGEAARAGDAGARRVLDRAARHLGLALGGLINLLAPEALAVGGGVVESETGFWEATQASIAEGCFAAIRARCRVELTQLGGDQGLLGSLIWGQQAAAESSVRLDRATPPSLPGRR